MVFSWLGRLRPRPRVLDNDVTLSSARHMPLLSGMTNDELKALVELANQIAGEKDVTVVEPLGWSEPMASTLFLQMALPVLALGASGLAGWAEVVLYPQAFRVRDKWHDAIGLVHEGESVLIGQARSDGPLILSWPDVKASPHLDGWNVVIHEVAHKLDMLNGAANGCPPLHKGMSREEWAHDWSLAYRHFCQEADHGVDGWLDPYAAEDPAEFFAVMTEAFFEQPHLVQNDYPTLYGHLCRFYKQDPFARLAEAPTG